MRGPDGVLKLRIWYDALGRRILSETCDASGDPVKTTRHIYDGLAAIVELEDEGGAPVTWNLAREFIWSGGAGVSAGQSGGAGVSAGQWFPEPLVLIDHTGAGDVPAGQAEHLYFVHDALGSVVGLTNDPAALAALDPNYPGGGGSAGVGGTTGILPALVERYDYDPYGATYIACRLPSTYDEASETRDPNLLSDPAAWQPCESSRFGNPFLWTAQRYDPGVRLYHFLVRTYSPTLGRWMQRDPAGYVDGVSLYQYVSSGPTNWLDPVGLDRCYEGWLHTYIVIGPINGMYFRIDFSARNVDYTLETVLLALIYGWNVGVPGWITVRPWLAPDREPDVRSPADVDAALVRYLQEFYTFHYHALLRNCDTFCRYFLDYGLVPNKLIPADFFIPGIWNDGLEPSSICTMTGACVGRVPGPNRSEGPVAGSGAFGPSALRGAGCADGNGPFGGPRKD